MPDEKKYNFDGIPDSTAKKLNFEGIPDAPTGDLVAKGFERGFTAPFNQMSAGVEKIQKNDLTGILDVAAGGLTLPFAPLMGAAEGLKQGSIIGQTIATGLEAVPKAVSGIYDWTQKKVESGLDFLGIPQGGKAPEALNEIGKLGAQFILPGAAIKATRGIRGVAEQAISKVVEPPMPEVVGKLNEGLKGITRARAATNKLYHEERSKRAGKLAELQTQPASEKTLPYELSALKGELPKREFEPIKLEQQDVNQLFDIANQSELRPFEKLSVKVALADVLEGNRLPGNAELRLIEKVYGGSTVKNLLEARPWQQKAWNEVMEAINIPRALMASFDMSAPLRQGVVLGVSHPKQSIPAFKDMHRYFFSEKAMRELDVNIEARPNAQLYSDLGLYLGERKGEALALTQREEAFMSKLADKIPFLGKGVKASERAYLGYLNKLRVDVFDNIDAQFKKKGLSPENDPEVYGALAKYINQATGRGSLGKYGERAAPLLNAVFFSPRLQAARIQMLGTMFNPNIPKPLRVQAWKDIGIFAGAGLTLLGLAKTAGADIETDPRSSDFAKIKVGNTRMDPWGGFQQWIRFAAQMATGQRKSSTTGQITTMNDKKFPFETRKDVAQRFIEQKMSPQAAIIRDMLAGQNMIGENLEFGKEARERLVPLFMQDAIDAFKEGGVERGLVIFPGFYGMGTQTYTSSKFPGALKSIKTAK